MVEKYSVFELRQKADFAPTAIFSCLGIEVIAKGFRISDDEYAIRFMPEAEGDWLYSVNWGNEETKGTFVCVPNTGINHGKVITEGFGFRYSDGMDYFPVGTTCYAWAHQLPELIDQTLKTLESAPFNKLRMCVFPKHMPYNNNDPDMYPFQKNENGSWDVSTPCFEFWNHLETHIVKLGEMGIEADLILFHPYDRWGFSRLSMNDCMIYLDYCIRRLSAYRNIWWSLANEYDLVTTRTAEDWDVFGNMFKKEDVYGHMLSIHNFVHMYPKKDWMTHVSAQNNECRLVKQWRNTYELPVIMDEFGYEGDIEPNWGNISAFELINRSWTAIASGGFVTHGETFDREDEVLWWAKGGLLHGESPERFAFLKDIKYEIGNLDPPVRKMPVNMNPNTNSSEQLEESDIARSLRIIMALPEAERNQFMLMVTPLIGRNPKYMLQYLGRNRPSVLTVRLPENGSYQVEAIDVWEMTRTVVVEEGSGNLTVKLPGKEGIAVLVTCLSGENL